MSDPTPTHPERPSAITTITAGTNPVTGEDQYVIEYEHGETQAHVGAWAEARELAHRAGLDHRDDGPVGVTRWSRRTT